MKLFLEKGANIEARDKVNFDLSSFFLNVFISISYNSEHQKYGLTPLHRASHYGNDKIVKLLLENGANIEAKNSV